MVVTSEWGTGAAFIVTCLRKDAVVKVWYDFQEPLLSSSSLLYGSNFVRSLSHYQLRNLEFECIAVFLISAAMFPTSQAQQIPNGFLSATSQLSAQMPVNSYDQVSEEGHS